MKAVSMGTVLCVLLAGAATLLASGGQKASDGTLVVPEGTEFKLQLQTSINSKSSKVGDRLLAILVAPAYVNNTVAFPKGTRIEGSITSVKRAAHRGKGGVITPTFNYAELADGRKIAILGLLTEVYPGNDTGDVHVDLEGDLKGGGPSLLKKTALVAGAAAAGGTAGIGAGVAAGIGGLFGAIFIPRGHEAILRVGAVIGMRLVRSTEVPVSAQQPVAMRLIPRAHRRS
jgi:hypothetical protein